MSHSKNLLNDYVSRFRRCEISLDELWRLVAELPEQAISLAATVKNKEKSAAVQALVHKLRRSGKRGLREKARQLLVEISTQ